MEHVEMFLEINTEQIKKLKSGTIKFKNLFKQIVLPFKIYSDFEWLLKRLQINDRDKSTSYTEKSQDLIPCSLLTKLYVLMIDLANQLFFIEKKMQSISFLKQFLKNMIIAKK